MNSDRISKLKLLLEYMFHGKMAPGQMINPPVGKETVQLNAARARINWTEIWVKPFKFCSIRRVDNANTARVKKDLEIAKGLGEIAVKVYRAAIQEQIPDPTEYAKQHKNGIIDFRNSLERPGNMSWCWLGHGWALMVRIALLTFCSYGAERREKQHDGYKVNYLDDGFDKPVAVYVLIIAPAVPNSPIK